MKQSTFRYLGALNLVLVVAFVAVFGSASLRSAIILGMGVAGVAAVLAGTAAAVSVGPLSVTWRGLVAATYAVFGVALLVQFALAVRHGGSGTEMAVFASLAVSALSLLWFAYDVGRDGGRVDIDANVEESIEL